MRVSELIELLNECESDAEVCVVSYGDIGNVVVSPIDEDMISDECSKVFIDIC